jgi:hypothetical protein
MYDLNELIGKKAKYIFLDKEGTITEARKIENDRITVIKLQYENEDEYLRLNIDVVEVLEVPEEKEILLE